MFLWFNEITPKFQEKGELCDVGMSDTPAGLFLYLSTVKQNHVFKKLLPSEVNT
jgi:hypothetical protein